MGNEREHVGEFVEQVNHGALSILKFTTDEGSLDVSAFADCELPNLRKGARYRFRTTERAKGDRVYTNLKKERQSYLIEPLPAARSENPPSQRAVVDSVPPRIGAVAPGKIDSREIRISRLSCTSSACLIVSALVEKGNISNMDEAGRQVLMLAKKLEEHIFNSEAV